GRPGGGGGGLDRRGDRRQRRGVETVTAVGADQIEDVGVGEAAARQRVRDGGDSHARTSVARVATPPGSRSVSVVGWRVARRSSRRERWRAGRGPRRARWWRRRNESRGSTPGDSDS